MPAHYLRCAYRSTISSNGADCVNVFHIEADPLSDPLNYASAASDISTWLTTLYRAVLNTGTILHTLTVTEETYPSAPTGQGVASIEAAGTRTVSDSLLSPGLMAILHLSTATPKRYARGHLAMPPAIGSSALASNGGWATANAYYTAITAFGSGLTSGHTAGSTSYTPIIFSRTRAKQSLSPFVFPVTGTRIQPDQYFLRSRRTVP